MGGTGFLGVLLAVFIANNTPTASSATVPPVGASLRFCDFEDGITMCGYTQDQQDDFNWALTSQNSLNTQTGPTSDHTYQTSQGHYVLIDATNIRIGAKARLLSPAYNDSRYGALCMHFYSYMFGDGVGSLNIYIKPTSQQNLSQPVWHMSGNQGERWILGEVNVLVNTISSLYQVVFEGIRGTNYRADIAVDDISFTEGACPSRVVPSGARSTITTVPPPITALHLDTAQSLMTGPGDTELSQSQLEDLSCDFESLCKYQGLIGDTLNWTEHTGPSQAELNGPGYDHTTGTSYGHYLYIENSGSVKQGQYANLASPVITTGNGDYCLKFWYNMYGHNTGSLSITLAVAHNIYYLWDEVGDQGDNWYLGQVPFMVTAPQSRIIFEGVVGSGYLSNIALDDITVTKAKCTTPPVCNFDNRDMCSWMNLGLSDNFDWILNRANSTPSASMPTKDHSMNSAQGYYIYFENQLSVSSEKASYLLSAELSPTNGTTHCFKFWYSMMGSGVGTLQVNYVVDNQMPGSTLWQYGKVMSSQWNLATIPVQSATEFKLLFVGVVGLYNQGIIAVDDITYMIEDCGLTPYDALPTGATTATQNTFSTLNPSSFTSSATAFNCNFESNMCAWVNSQNDNYDWMWGGTAAQVGNTSNIPKIDHTTNSGGGHYVYYSMREGVANGVALLNSPMISTTSFHCLRYWYNMNSNVKQLDVYIRMGASLSLAQQSITGSQGPNWHESYLNINTTGLYQVVFSGVNGVSGIDGVIALDDITLTSGICEAPALSVLNLTRSNSFSCDFEQPDLCKFTQDTSDNFDWTQQQHGTDTVGTGPENDHTYGTPDGHYVYAEASNVNGQIKVVGNVARLNSPTFISVEEDICVSFFYHMYGQSMGSLNIRLRTGSNFQTLNPPIWTMSGDLGNQWNVGEVTLPALTITKNFQIVFEAVRGTSYFSDIALDDVSVKLGPCESRGNCDFQMDTCAWSNIHNDSMDWLSQNGTTPSDDTGPMYDHTYGNMSGKYIFIETSYPVIHGDNAILQSELFDPESDMVCFHFFYNMFGVSIGTLRVWLVYYNTSLNKLPVISRQVVWELSGNQSQAWYEGIVPISKPQKRYKIQIEGVAGWSYTGDIAIDDISFVHSTNPCILTPAKATPPVGQILANFNCNFDANFCGWTSDSTGGQLWIRNHGSTPTTDTGPDQDHTTGNGYYIYLETSIGLPNMKARLDSPLITPGAQYCFSFWYHMYGETVASLDVQLKAANGTTSMIWMATGSHGNQWIQAHVDIDVSTKSFANQIVLEAVEGSSFTGDIAVDDVRLSAGFCSSGGASPIDCDFETPSICGYVQDKQDQFDWTWFSGPTQSDDTGPITDHTLGTNAGHYMYTEASFNPEGSIARLWSQPFRPVAGQCLSFYYHMYGANMGNLSVSYGYLNQSTTVSHGLTQLWSLSGDQGDQWLRQNIPLPTPQTQPVNIVFQGIVGNGFMSDMAIDDVRLLQFCPAPGIIV